MFKIVYITINFFVFFLHQEKTEEDTKGINDKEDSTIEEKKSDEEDDVDEQIAELQVQ